MLPGFSPLSTLLSKSFSQQEAVEGRMMPSPRISPCFVRVECDQIQILDEEGGRRKEESHAWERRSIEQILNPRTLKIKYYY